MAPTRSRPTVSVERDPDAGWVRIGGQFALPARFLSTVEPTEADLPVCDLAVVVENGHPVCEELRLRRRPGGPPVSGTVLRRIPVGDYVTRAVEQLGHAVYKRSPDGPPTYTFDGVEAPVRAVEFDEQHDMTPIGGMPRTAEYKAAARTPREAGRISDDTLREVADIYRKAHAERAAPTEAVATEMSISRTSAGRWVRRARERGYLGAALPRRAGEGVSPR
jgi:hypothetical protein